MTDKHSVDENKMKTHIVERIAAGGKELGGITQTWCGRQSRKCRVISIKRTMHIKVSDMRRAAV